MVEKCVHGKHNNFSEKNRNPNGPKFLDQELFFFEYNNYNSSYAKGRGLGMNQMGVVKAPS